VVALFIAAGALFVFGGITAVNVTIESFQGAQYDANGIRAISVEMVELIDVFLLGAVLLITAVGFFQLFINSDVDVPGWLRIDSIEELKVQLLAVVVVMLGILFLGAATESDGGPEILLFGGGISLVIAAIGFAVYLFGRSHKSSHAEQPATGDSDGGHQ
jgi:uncharacterized membrane protein YqhA